MFFGPLFMVMDLYKQESKLLSLPFSLPLQNRPNMNDFIVK